MLPCLQELQSGCGSPRTSGNCSKLRIACERVVSFKIQSAAAARTLNGSKLYSTLDMQVQMVGV